MHERKKPAPLHNRINQQKEQQEQKKVPFILNRPGENAGRLQQHNDKVAQLQAAKAAQVDKVNTQEPEAKQDSEAALQEEPITGFMYNDVPRMIDRQGSDLYISPFTRDEYTLFALTGDDAPLIWINYQMDGKDRRTLFKLLVWKIISPAPGESFNVHFMDASGTEINTITYTYNPPDKKPSVGEGEAPNNEEPAQEDTIKSEDEKDVETPSEPYWTHAWHIDRKGREALWIWEVGGKRWYPKPHRGFSYIQKMARLEPGEPGYDPRFLKYRHKPQVGDYVSEDYNWWFKKSPGWDNKDHKDDGTADYNDLGEFKGVDYNKKGTGFYYMGYSYNPEIDKILEEERRKKEPKPEDPNAKYIGVETNYRGYVNAEKGIILHTTPDPEDKDYRAIQKLDDSEKKKHVISNNQPLTVIAQGSEENEGWILVEDGRGNKGWIEQRFTAKKANIQADDGFDRYTVKSGDTLENLIKSYYKDYPYATGNDRRTIALAIYLYNKDRPGGGVYRNYHKYRNSGSWKDYVDPWMQETRANYQSIELYAGGEVILPPKEFIEEMRQRGEIEKRPDFVNFMIETGRVVQGFVDGVGEGFIDAIVSTAEDLYDLIVDIFTGEIFGQIADLFEMLWEKGLSGVWDMIKDFGTSTWEELKAAWNNPNPYERGKYFGEIIGAVLFEVVLAILTAGVGTAVKLSVKTQKVLKWFPNMNTKKVVPNNVDHYADDIRKMNKDKDLDRKKKLEKDLKGPQKGTGTDAEVDALAKKDKNQPIEDDIKDGGDSAAAKKAAMIQAKSIVTAGDMASKHPSKIMPTLWTLTTFKGVRGFSFASKGTNVFEIYMHGSKHRIKPKDGKYDTIKKPMDVPSIKNVEFDWDEVLSGHSDLGERAIQSGNKTIFKGLSDNQIKNTVRGAYKNIHKKLKTQGERIKVIGDYDGWTVEFWINKSTRTVETAYPTHLNDVDLRI